MQQSHFINKNNYFMILNKSQIKNLAGIFTYILLCCILLSSCSNRQKAARDQGSGIETADYDSSGTISGAFDIPELNVMPSPDEKKTLSLGTTGITDFDVSPAGPYVVAIVNDGE